MYIVYIYICIMHTELQSAEQTVCFYFIYCIHLIVTVKNVRARVCVRVLRIS